MSKFQNFLPALCPTNVNRSSTDAPLREETASRPPRATGRGNRVPAASRHWERKPRPGRLAPLGEGTASRQYTCMQLRKVIRVTQLHSSSHAVSMTALYLIITKKPHPRRKKVKGHPPTTGQRSPPHFSQARKGKTPAKNVKTFAPSALY